MRYTIYDPILNFYKRNPKSGYNNLIKQKGYQFLKEFGMNKWMFVYTQKLVKKGYKLNVAATEVTGGDNDFLVVDHKLKEFCFWENGFQPFCGNDPQFRVKNFPQTHNLTYWSQHRA